MKTAIKSFGLFLPSRRFIIKSQVSVKIYSFLVANISIFFKVKNILGMKGIPEGMSGINYFNSFIISINKKIRITLKLNYKIFLHPFCASILAVRDKSSAIGKYV
ncbi:MAG: hypothetical protein CO127_05410 [Ignavibacteria bacterium CG_4_9_14_3_um_filter_36_18]|nr:MAG: hypothetical protein CO127_05410 [Ignavibacteria bacterium CG_4_9_14_3_um_filter_36_18]